MTKQEFKNLLQQQFLILDGASGTQMQKAGMPTGVCPEKWALDNPEILKKMQREYSEAGSDVVYTFTFGGNRVKLGEYGCADQVIAWNRRLAEISREAVGSKCLVAGDISSIGQFVVPFGDFPFEAAVDIFKEQIQGLVQGGVDFLVIETMIDIQETRAALLAAKEVCDLPVCVSLTFDEDGRTLTGTDPLAALVTLQSLGADAVGCNCSCGPDKIAEFIKIMKPYAKVPLLAKPNAGLPHLLDGKTVFDMGAAEFAGYAKTLVEAGANLLGGCCGTSPEYISTLKEALKDLKPIISVPQEKSLLSSAQRVVFAGLGHETVIVGERINPTGKKALQAELREGKLGEVKRFAAEQAAAGASVLDVNVGTSGIDERAMMIKVVETLATRTALPLCLDSSSPEVLEAALRIYPGRALINSISAEESKFQKLLPIVAKYGAMFVALPLDDSGIPTTAIKRIELLDKIALAAREYGYSNSEIVVDGLVMTVSAEQSAARETLDVVGWAAQNGFNSILGLSNISFGLPERIWINAAFLAMAAARGLTMAIANPSLDILVNFKFAADVLTMRDKNSLAYIKRFVEQEKTDTSPIVAQTVSIREQIRRAIIEGQLERIEQLLQQALQNGEKVTDLIDEDLIPAIARVGELFEAKKYFLPQLIQSAQTLQAAFGILEPLLQQDVDNVKIKEKVILATVKGDIHDIGKNIVALMLRNSGFEVYDLGKDVAAETIVAEVKRTGAKLVGLSALMTTTMTEMPRVIVALNDAGLSTKVMIGGAAVDEKYAEEIGASGYSKNAYDAVKLAVSLI